MLGLLLTASGCKSPGSALCYATKVGEIAGFSWPECVRPRLSGNGFFVSNIDTKTKEGWGTDGQAFISLIGTDGKLTKLKWIESTTGAELNSPKGMCPLQDKLYIADNTRLLCCNEKDGSGLREIKITGADRLNDITTDGTNIYVSDTANGRIYKVDANEHVTTIKAPEAVNGITWRNGKLIAASVGNGEIYDVDPSGKADPAPWGFELNFKGIDGIEILDNGMAIVTDLKGGKVYCISANRKRLAELAAVETPADLTVDRKANRLYVPALKQNKVVIFQLNFVGGSFARE